MPKYTENLNLFEYDVEKDGKNTYNISQCLNDNWDKIDSALGNVANLTTEQKANFVSAINEIVSNLDKKSSIDLNNLSALGQSILDRKVEVEALLQQNGYAKFSWKEDNKISNLIFQWGICSSNLEVTMPISYYFKKYIVIGLHQGTGAENFEVVSNYFYENNLSKIYFFTNYQLESNLAILWFSIGT